MGQRLPNIALDSQGDVPTASRNLSGTFGAIRIGKSCYLGRNCDETLVFVTLPSKDLTAKKQLKQG